MRRRYGDETAAFAIIAKPRKGTRHVDACLVRSYVRIRRKTMFKHDSINYNGKELIYDTNRSQGMIIPIYHDIDGRLYMPLNKRFVTVCEVIEALENYQENVMLEVL